MDLVSLHSTSAHTAMHCRSFRDDDILKCPEQFCSFWLCEPAPRRATLPKIALVLWRSAFKFTNTMVCFALFSALRILRWYCAG